MSYEKRIFTSVSDAERFRESMIRLGYKTTISVTKNYSTVTVKKVVDTNPKYVNV